jgi:ribosomal protein S12 methylthiotransferase accessory factor
VARSDPDETVDILDLRDRLVSPYCGVIRKLHRVHKDVLEPAVPYIWRAEIANHRFAPCEDGPIVASGKGITQANAIRSALGESVERYCALRFPDDCMVARHGELKSAALDPAMLVLHAPDRARALGYSVYDETTELAWLGGIDLSLNAEIQLPAQAVYLMPPPDTPELFETTSNGLAAGATPEAAQLGGLLEVVERDAFLNAWYHRLSPARLDWRTHPDPDIRSIGKTYARRDVEIELYSLPTDHAVPVVLGMAVDLSGNGPAIVIGLGCSRRIEKAAASAMLEVAQVRPAIRMKLRDPKVLARREELLADHAQVTELEDHDLLYTDLSMLSAFDIWRSTQAVASFEEGAGEFDAHDDLAWLVGKLAAVGANACVCDVTTPDIIALGLHVWRGIVPDFQPIHFGEAKFRSGGTRLYEMPMRLGLADRAVTRAELNPLPHPLS